MFSPAKTTTARAWLASAAFAAGAAHAVEFNLSLGTLDAPSLRVKEVTVSVGERAFGLVASEVTILGRTWRNVLVGCGAFRFEPELIECRDGVLDTGTSKMPIHFTWRPKAQTLDFTAIPQPKEVWRLQAKTTGSVRRSEVTVENGSLANLAAWIPGGLPRTSAGTFDGKFLVDSAQEQSLWGEVALRGAAFADASGLHAGEKLDAVVRFFAQPAGTAWRWQAELDWTGGEVFWQPVYSRAIGQSLRAEGVFDERRIGVSRATITLPGIGELEASDVEWDRRAGRMRSANLRSSRLDAAAFYTHILKPHLAGTAFSDLRVTGALEVSGVRVRDAELEAVDFALHDLSFEDPNQRLAVRGANGRVPWHRSEETHLDLALKGGSLYKVPFGPVRLPVSMRGTRFRLKSVDLPVLDGAITMRGFATDPPDADWRWGFRGAIAPISMERLTKALGMPVMYGTLAADIPRVVYSGSTLQIDGKLVFKVFDGTMVASNVKLVEPFGRAPRLTADIEGRGLDLDLVTRTYSFGSIKGRADIDIAGMELSNWSPVKFDIRVRSSPGEYPRKISQKAVENITALGGATAAAAIQRLFLRFFEQFDYEKLGWSCRLENGVCRMGGVENSAQGYVIVKGSGVPGLSVMGYNRDVNWEILRERVTRIMQDNVRAVVE